MDEGMHPPFPKKGWPRICQELPKYNTYNHSSHNIQCPTTQPHRTQDWQHSGEIDPRPHKYWLSVEFSMAYGKKPIGDNIICRLYKGLWFHIQREDGANSTRIRSTKRNRRSHNDSIQKHQNESAFSRWKQRLLQHCSWGTARRHTCTIPLNHLSRLRA